MTRPWWTPEEVADYYRIKIHRVWRRIRQGDIRAKNVGTKGHPEYRISQAEINRLDARLNAVL